MKKSMETVGFVIAVMGVSGTIDRLAYQPIMGPILNAFNRYAVPHIGFLTGYEVFANLIFGAAGVIVMVAASRMPA